MVRVLIICSLLIAIASCRGEKKSVRTVNLSNGDTKVEVIESELLKDETPIQKDVQASEAQVNEERKKEEIITAVKQLKMMLDASVTSANPMRVAGIVASNKTADIPLRESVPDTLLYSTLEQVTNNPAFKQIQDLVSKKQSVEFDSRARVVSTGSEIETIKAVSMLLANPEAGYMKDKVARIPVTVELSPNFFKSDPSIDRKEFYAVLATDKDGKYSHFNLHNRINLKEVGKLTLPLTESKEVKDQKMIVEFIEERNSENTAYRIEKVIPLQLQLVNFIKN